MESTRYEKVPVSVPAGRSGFFLGNENTLTMTSGKVYPVLALPVLPGDTYIANPELIMRQVTPLLPTMGRAYLDIAYFFVPDRLTKIKIGTNGAVDNKYFQHMMGERSASTVWSTATEPAGLDAELLFVDHGSLANYLYRMSTPYNDITLTTPSSKLSALWTGSGFVTGVTTQTLKDIKGPKVDLSYYNAYALIFNHWIRDQAFQEEMPLLDCTKGSKLIDSKNGTGFLFKGNSTLIANDPGIVSFGECASVNKYHDRFTSARPYPQLGASPSILSGSAPVIGSDTFHGIGSEGLKFAADAGGSWYTYKGIGLDLDQTTGKLGAAQDTTYFPNSSSHSNFDGTNMVADLSAASALSTINTFLNACAINNVLVSDARFGTYYRSLIYNQFGVVVPDATVQVPEPLGNIRIPLHIHQVAQTSEASANSPLGNVAGFGYTIDSSGYVEKTVTEHGIIMAVATVRTEQIYSEGLNKIYGKMTRYDFYQPALAKIPAQPIMKDELSVGLSLTGATNETYRKGVFGYNDAWDEYRVGFKSVCGFLAPGYSDSESGWTYAKSFGADVAGGGAIVNLSSAFLKQDKNNIGDTLADPNAAWQFILQVSFNDKAFRAMPTYSIAEVSL